MRIAYARVSTDEQLLDRQLEALNKYGYDRLIQEKYTGTKKDRAGLTQLMDTVREGDTVIVEAISRLGRNTLDILTTVEELNNMGVTFISLKENMDTSTPTGKDMFSMMAVISQLERDLIAERTKEGLASAKKRGVKLGRPQLDNDKIRVALQMYDSGEYSIKDIVSQVGISQGKLYKEINKRKLQEGTTR
ncbi:recombinase family protein [Bacillus pseudomycoides]|uniref:recombinase family protein n=1 Tax=Bacillus pseudomycoides TaxID=64104 RepID=UPI000BEDEAAE|nr:recombinase family protein [Bacillus pseudomycoides]PEB41406.1 resolvase [Bacillus pseudomycoides]PGD99806.1 resolvase [Bacillus pseudomycoides]PGE03650.1 resolvase [Bacillus pseudomycoides]PHE70699.1 resolvase [Bacillus pseudomycoides]PHG16530.1 resolvase [Bacillus pseudomycoides]